MEIEIKNCNNIDYAKLALSQNRLNIKFAPNGTGKSTIAKAIKHSSSGDQNSLGELLPFKFRVNNPENKEPEVFGAEAITSLMCFNEDYVNQFVFKPDELVSNSFDIFIRNEAYRENEQAIEEIVARIKQLFSGNAELEELIANLRELGGAFKLTQTGLSKASTGMKGLSGGNKIQHIPSGLESYKPFIQGTNGVGWIDWQVKGYEFFDLSDSCPFCTSDASEKRDQIKKVGQEYDKNVIKNLVGIIAAIEKLGTYFSDDAKSKLTTITNLKDGLEKEHEAFIVSVKKQIDNLLEKLEKLKTLSGFDFKDGEKVSEKLPSYRIDLQFFSELNSAKTAESVASINTSIDSVINQAGVLQGKINIQRREMQRVIEKHEKEINEFLAYAGYRYKVQVAGEGGQSQLKLLHADHGEHLSGGSQHLSFGERNAFSIVLFMYECLAKKPDLIILDDPISSFDKNKKYAILEMLFRRDSASCLKGKLVLMLTHDVEPVIDTIRSVHKQFQNQIAASFLKLRGGQIIDQPIQRDDIKMFPEICSHEIASGKDDVIKLIYLRRKYEIVDGKGDAYQVLSNLLHKRTQAQAIDNRSPMDASGQYPAMDGYKFSSGCAAIGAEIAGFDYAATLNKLSNSKELRLLYASSQNGYEKLQIFRLLELKVENSVIQKFINETYHIENEFICQLDPAQFDTVPEYVIEECDKLLAETL